MSKIDSTQTRDEILEFAGKDAALGFLLPCNIIENHTTNEQQFVDRHGITAEYFQYYDDCRANFFSWVSVLRIPKNGRVCGVVTGKNDDGSLRITVIGNSVFDIRQGNCVTAHITGRAKGNSWSTVGEPNSITRKMLDNSGLNPQFVGDPYSYPEVYEQYATFEANIQNSVTPIPAELILTQNYEPNWSAAGSGKNSYTSNFATMNGEYLDTYSGIITLTKNPSTTLKINVPFDNIAFQPIKNSVYDMGVNNVGGDVYMICYNIISAMTAALGGANETIIPDSEAGQHKFAADVVGTYAGMGKLFNVVLTRDIDAAINYVDNNVLPPDAFLYPYDVDNIPTNDTGQNPNPEDETPSGDNPNENDGDPDDDITPTPMVTPSATPQSLTNNNLYWLLTAQLKNFIDWFWTDATSIASLDDLWDKIKGLYNNLSEAVLNIRYMPVHSDWIGGTTLDSSIIVGMIEKPGQVLTINKTVSSVRHIGDININEFYNSFCDYSPYTDILLYLPFHGFLDLDTNLLMGNTLKVYCAYDISSGTVQYFIYRDSVLINTCIAKMAVDIPITLQTKNDRDSAVFQNVMSSVGSLIGAGASVATANPIGLVMSMGNLSGSQTHAAPLALKGTIGESGAFYAPNRCAIYVKNPKYNKPDAVSATYASQVGYPCNGIYKLSQGIGYTQVYNPKINFSGNTPPDSNRKMLPLENEVQEIYNYLTEGVIL